MHGGRQPDALGGNGEQGVEALQTQRQLRPAFGTGHGVHLINDDGVDPAQRLPPLGGEQQKQRFRRGDEDIRRRAQKFCPLSGGRIPGTHTHGDRGGRQSLALPFRADAFKGNAQIALHVGGQRFDRRDVKNARGGLFVGLLRRVRLLFKQRVDGM